MRTTDTGVSDYPYNVVVVPADFFHSFRNTHAELVEKNLPNVLT